MTSTSTSERDRDVRRNTRILVLDDESIIADTLVAVLALHGYECTAAYSGREAVERSRSFQPHLLIADVLLPESNGIEAAVQIKAMLPECKVLLFSGQAAAAQLLEEARSRGHHFEILGKPVHPAELLARISAVA